MTKRGLIIGGYDTAKNGFTMSELTLQTPKLVESYLQVDGMHGSLDYCDAAGGPIFQTSPLRAVFELSEGNLAYREKVIRDFIRSVHGKKCPILHPDHGGKLLEGRVQLSKDFSNLAHAQVTLTANCQPWFADPYDSILELPILDRSQNCITFENVAYMEELSTCGGSVIGDTDVVTVTLVTDAAEIHTYAVFKLQLEANETYYLGARQLGKGYWLASGAPEKPETFSPIVQAGADGCVYIWVCRLQSYEHVNLVDVVVVPSSKAFVLKNGDFSSPLLPEKTAAVGVLLSVNGRSSMHYSNKTPRFTAPPGDSVVLAFRHDTSDEVAYETLRWRRRWLE